MAHESEPISYDKRKNSIVKLLEELVLKTLSPGIGKRIYLMSTADKIMELLK